jgi:hypothetical protein
MGYNREHSFPQSWFGGASPMVSDLWIIYPTDAKVNGYRSNYAYGVVGSATTTSLNGSKLGSSASPGFSGTVFEPIDGYKGDLARGQFYVSTRYFLEDGSWPGGPGVQWREPAAVGGEPVPGVVAGRSRELEGAVAERRGVRDPAQPQPVRRSSRSSSR